MNRFDTIYSGSRHYPAHNFTHSQGGSNDNGHCDSIRCVSRANIDGKGVFATLQPSARFKKGIRKVNLSRAKLCRCGIFMTFTPAERFGKGTGKVFSQAKNLLRHAAAKLFGRTGKDALYEF
ncbi:MAG: hypothetical protein LBP64_11285 [Tannerella sp.]|jgi:hypothetical protein|nr:hypothetical protein [Tannerella sp.]